MTNSESRERTALLEALRDARIAAGFSQAELARRLRKPQSFVSKYESGERRVEALELRQIAEALGSSWQAMIAVIERRLQEEQ